MDVINVMVFVGWVYLLIYAYRSTKAVEAQIEHADDIIKALAAYKGLKAEMNG